MTEILSQDGNTAFVRLPGDRYYFVPLERLQGPRTGLFGEYAVLGEAMNLEQAHDLLRQRFDANLAWASEDGRQYVSRYWIRIEGERVYSHAMIGLRLPEDARVGEHVLRESLGLLDEPGPVWRHVEGLCYVRVS